MKSRQEQRMAYIKNYRDAWRRYAAVSDVGHILGGLIGLEKDEQLMGALLRAEKRYRKELRLAEKLLAKHSISSQ